MKTALILTATFAPLVLLGASSESSNDNGTAIGVAAVLITLLVGWIIIRMQSQSEWKRRPQRLCTNCLALAQPFQKKNGVYYCPFCQADNPAPLDSPFAQQHFARQQQSA